MFKLMWKYTLASIRKLYHQNQMPSSKSSIIAINNVEEP